MRSIAVLAAAAFLLMPVAAPVQAHHAEGGKHASAAADVYASAKKQKKKAKKPNKKPKAGKEQYLRAVPAAKYN